MTEQLRTPDISATTKLKAFWHDERTYWNRLVLSALAVFTACFTFLFFGPFEMVSSNESSLVFTTSDVAKIMGVFTLCVFFAASLLLALLRGKIFDIAVTAVFSLTLCGYIQGNSIGGKMSAMTGEKIIWTTQKGQVLLNLLLWIVVFIIPFIALIFTRKIWGYLLKFLSILLVLMQVAGLISILATKPANDETNGNTASEEQSLYLTYKDFVDYSANKNTLVFLLDRLDYSTVAEVLSVDPDFFDKLDGFVSYTNAVSEFARTMPAVNYMLTGYDENIYQTNASDFFDKSWESGDRHILKDLTDANYTIDMYGDISTLFGCDRKYLDYVSNMTDQFEDIYAPNLIKNMSVLSTYRYAPVFLKPFFWFYSDDMNLGIHKDSNRYIIDETVYKTQTMALTADSAANYFKFYHFIGPHPPYKLTVDGVYGNTETNRMTQTKGCFNILFNAFDVLKSKGIYKDATIIILADHGEPINDSRPVEKATCIGMFYKAAGEEGTPLRTSKAPVSLKNIPATIIKSAGLDYSAYGTPLDEIAEDADIVRHFYKSSQTGTHESKVYYYDIYGDAADFNNWKMVKEYDTKGWFY